MIKCHSNQDYGEKCTHIRNSLRSCNFFTLQSNIKDWFRHHLCPVCFAIPICWSLQTGYSRWMSMNNTYQRTALQTSHNPDLLLSWHSGRRTLADSFPSHSSRSFSRHNWLWSRRVHYRCNEVELVRGFCL